jgi:hypothetical protein
VPIPGRAFSGSYLFSRGKIFLADTADFADEIIGEILPLGALLVFVIFPAADAADVYHDCSPFFKKVKIPQG